jgi:hypothetical protein
VPKDDEGLDRFAPPPEVETPLELDPQWVAERAAKQTEWANRPRLAKRHIGGVIAALVLIAVAIAVIAYIVRL